MRYLFVTGKLAEPALRQVLAQLAPKVGFEYEIAVLNISVAALMTPDWIARHLEVPDAVDRIMIPGWCGEDARPIQEKTHLPVEIGPKDLLDLPGYFGQRRQVDLQEYRIEILAEINYASRLDRQSLLAEARRLHAEGADVIDLGCDPATVWTDIADAVKCLREAGLRVSVDSFHPREIAEAVRAGAELVLSVNSSNIEAAPDWGCEVVLIPDSPHRSGDSSAGSDSWLTTLERHMEWLAKHGVAFRVDPILEPIGSGFADSLGRYLEFRRRYPQVPMLMGIGNLTELSEVDSAGVNLLLLGLCEELNIGSVLTTQVANWCQSCVRECDLARRLVHYAVRHGVPPKNLDPRLVMLRDSRLRRYGTDWIEQLASRIRDPNFRIFAENGQVHLLNNRGYWRDADPFRLIREVLRQQAITPDHAFYLGYEMAKAVIALSLGKNYVQDEPLQWGLLTRPERPHGEISAEAPAPTPDQQR
jgi:dihydropteroate synthase-like protein